MMMMTNVSGMGFPGGRSVVSIQLLPPFHVWTSSCDLETSSRLWRVASLMCAGCQEFMSWHDSRRMAHGERLDNSTSPPFAISDCSVRIVRFLQVVPFINIFQPKTIEECVHLESQNTSAATTSWRLECVLTWIKQLKKNTFFQFFLA